MSNDSHRAPTHANRLHENDPKHEDVETPLLLPALLHGPTLAQKPDHLRRIPTRILPRYRQMPKPDEATTENDVSRSAYLPPIVAAPVATRLSTTAYDDDRHHTGEFRQCSATRLSTQGRSLIDPTLRLYNVECARSAAPTIAWWLPPSTLPRQKVNTRDRNPLIDNDKSNTSNTQRIMGRFGGNRYSTRSPILNGSGTKPGSSRAGSSPEMFGKRRSHADTSLVVSDCRYNRAMPVVELNRRSLETVPQVANESYTGLLSSRGCNTE